ncbi:MAG: FAD-binding protein [Acidimicrobiales bacterium]
MTSTDLSPKAAPVLLTGWGRGSASAAHLIHIESQDELSRHVATAAATGGPLLARGLGRSYGDAAQCAGGTVLDCTAIDRLVAADFETGVVRVEAGCSLMSLLRLVVPKGWFLPVTPGTAHVSLGGAVAADVHGKNHHRDGAFGNFVDALMLVTPTGPVEAGPAKDEDVFWATLGGMGLTGAVTEVGLRLRPIETSSMLVDTERAFDLDDAMAKLSDADAQHGYSVAWIDGLARGRRLGRGVVAGADHACRSDLLGSSRRMRSLRRMRSPAVEARHIRIGLTPPSNILKPALVAAFNEMWFRKAPLHRQGELQKISSFFYPLDALADWNRLYGRRGFTQYQFVVPFGAERVVHAALEQMHSCGLVPTLCVLKRFGASDPAPLSFPAPGWTLAVDLPLGTGELRQGLDRVDELVAGANGRVYLAKDGRLRPDLLSVMYPRLDEWLATRDRLDPQGVFRSDLWRRLYRRREGLTKRWRTVHRPVEPNISVIEGA